MRPVRLSSGRKTRALALLSLTELLGMSVWFSASAVVPALTAAWGLTASGQAWLTMSVQIGFVAGALGSAVLNLADRLPGRWLFAVSSVLAGTATLLIPSGGGLPAALALRFLTGILLAGVYPVGMKLMATWTREDRGFGVGLLVGALTLGSAAPHLLKAFGEAGDWKAVLFLSGAMAVGGGLLAGAFVREGPYRTAAPKFDWKYAGTIWRDRTIALANMGYFGHMWELYAAWTWVPVFLAASFGVSGGSERAASVAGFVFIAAGGAGSLVAGKLGRPAWKDSGHVRGDGRQRTMLSGVRALVRRKSLASHRALSRLGLRRGRRFGPILGGGERAVSERPDRNGPDPSNEPGIPADSCVHPPGSGVRATRHLALGVRLPRYRPGRGHMGDAPSAPSARRGPDGLRPPISAG